MIYSQQEPDGSVSFWLGLHPTDDPDRTWLCSTTAGQAAKVEQLLRDGQRLAESYAEVLWQPADVVGLMTERGLPVSDEWAADFLADNAGNVQGLMTERGWEALATLLPATAGELAQGEPPAAGSRVAKG